MSENKKNSFFGGAAILAAGVVLVKVIGALYKIPLGNILSTAAFSDFNTAYSVYSLLIVISTAGLPVALSKMVAEANTLGRPGQARKIFRVSMLAFCVLGIVSFCVMAFFPGQLAGLMNNSGSYYSILALAPAVFFVCPLSAFRGYYQGHSQMVPTAVSQIIEALCKLVVGLILASVLVKQVENESVAAGGAIFGVSVGCGLALLYMAVRYARKDKDGGENRGETLDSSGGILATLIKLAIPITLGSSVMAIVTLIDTSLVYSRLQNAAGFTLDAARSIKGVYDQAMTLYNLPASFMVPLTASVIPAVSAARAKREKLQAGKISESALRTTALLSIPAGVGLFVLGEPIMSMLYHDGDPVLGGWMLSLLGLASISVCLMLITNSIMQANDYVNLPMLSTVIGCIVKIVVNYILVGNPDINIKGAPIGTIACFTTIAVLNLLFIKRVVPHPPRYLPSFAKPLLASLVMGVAAWAVYGLLSGFVGSNLATLVAICVAVVIYGALVILLKTITPDDLTLLPKGDKIGKILHIS